MSRVLYLCYDGLCDAIGQSQILPYLLGCAGRGHVITAISFEKPGAKAQYGASIQAACDEAGIDWRPQVFHRFPPILSKAWDMHRLRVAGMRAAARQPFDVVHGRSYQGSFVALEIKQRFGSQMLFDMRGFWADQRREGGRWRDSNPLGRLLYRQWKAREADMIGNADHIVVLAGAARNVIMDWASYTDAPISVIPCCADFSLFEAASPEQRTSARASLGIAADVPVLGYLGSIGTVYRFDIHLKLYDRIRRRDPRSVMLFVGREPTEQLVAQARSHGIDLGADRIVARSAGRGDISKLLAAADVGTGFCTDQGSSKGVSLTKVGEYLACGLPVIANEAVGDTAAILHELDAGFSIPDFSDHSLDAGADAFFALRAKDRTALRERARTMFDLPLAVKGYSLIYDALTPLRLPEGD